MNYLLDRKLISRQQHGFLSKRSTCTQLLESINDWSVALDNKNNVDIVYVDFSRAFDSVVHSKLLCKLASYGIRDDLLRWIHAFLSDRQQCVVVNQFISKHCKVLSGVPQGSVLGPLLFLLFVNDIVEIFDDVISCKLFADDLKLYSVIKSTTIISPLTAALDCLCVWSAMWQLKINIEKCILVHMGSSNYKFHYSLNGTQLKSTSHVRDLGVEIDSSLKFDHHLNNIVTRAYQRINLLFRGFVTKDAVFLKKMFHYINYVRPILEYCSPTWSPYLLCDIDKLEKVQKYFTRRISGVERVLLQRKTLYFKS